MLKTTPRYFSIFRVPTHGKCKPVKPISDFMPFKLEPLWVSSYDRHHAATSFLSRVVPGWHLVMHLLKYLPVTPCGLPVTNQAAEHGIAKMRGLDGRTYRITLGFS